MQIRCYFPDISYISETQKNNFQFLNNTDKKASSVRFMNWQQKPKTYCNFVHVN